MVVVACSKTAEPPAKHEDRHEAPAAASKLNLTITIGTASEHWTDAAFAATPKLVGAASDGEARDTWSLRELVHHNVGPTARVTKVIGAEGSQVIDAAAWDDATRVPIVHTTKRGALKFRWVDPSGTWGETAVKNVQTLEVTR